MEGYYFIGDFCLEYYLTVDEIVEVYYQGCLFCSIPRTNFTQKVLDNIVRYCSIFYCKIYMQSKKSSLKSSFWFNNEINSRLENKNPKPVDVLFRMSVTNHLRDDLITFLSIRGLYETHSNSMTESNKLQKTIRSELKNGLIGDKECIRESNGT